MRFKILDMVAAGAFPYRCVWTDSGRRGIQRSEVKEEPKAGDTNSAECRVGLSHAVLGLGTY
jgi:hypothetical protein